MVLVKARVCLKGVRKIYSSTALVDTGARMSLLDKLLAHRLGVEYTGRELSFIPVSGHRLKASEAIIPHIEVDDVKLKSEVVAVVRLPEDVKKVLRDNGLDDNFIVGLLTLERANLVPDTTRGILKKTEAFVI